MDAIVSDNDCINWHQVSNKSVWETFHKQLPMVYVIKEKDIQKGKLKFPHPYSWYDVTKSSYNVYISEI